VETLSLSDCVPVPVRGDLPRCSGMRRASALEKIKWLE
jgi:hypothetical protein